MSRFSDAVQRVTKACKNRLKINNVYDCARPLLVLTGLFGMGGTRICHEEGVYTLRNSKFSLLVFTFISLVWSPYYLITAIVFLFSVLDHPLPFSIRVALLILLFKEFITASSVGIGCMRTHVYWKRLTTILQIINNIDKQLEQANIRVKHWKITLKVTLLTLITVDYIKLLMGLRADVSSIEKFPRVVVILSMHLLGMWTILFLLIIHERFVGLNKLLEENATVTNIQIIGERNPRDSYILRRLTLARHVHEQLTQVVHLFSDTCRYVILGLVTIPIIETLYILLLSLITSVYDAGFMNSLFVHMARIVALIYICQANKAKRRVLNARLRHLVAFETDREIIHQVQQYIMYNAHSAPGLIDFQFTDIDNALLLTIIDVIISNALIIYSYTRQWIEFLDEDEEYDIN